MDHERWMNEAWRASEKSSCLKTHVGAVIVKDEKMIASGANVLPDGSKCKSCPREGLASGEKAELCTAIHAEQEALMDALRKHVDVKGAVMYVGKIKRGVKEPATKMFCPWCSKLVLASGLSGIIFYAPGGGCLSLTPKEFDDQTQAYLRSQP